MERVKTTVLWLPQQIRRLYDWVLSWADHPHAGLALWALAFAEASFFPIPPDVLLIALCLSKPKKAFYWAVICSFGSVLGGMAGYFLGWQFMNTIGIHILSFYHLTDKYAMVQHLYQKYDAWAVAIAGFTPLPYKLFTIAAGAFKITFFTFVIASILSRSARFFIVAAIIYWFGPTVKDFLDRYFNLCTVVFTILLIGGFIIIKWLM